MTTWAELEQDLVPVKAIAKRLGTTPSRLLKLSLAGQFPRLFNPAPGIVCIHRKDLDEIADRDWTDVQAVQHAFNQDRVKRHSAQVVQSILKPASDAPSRSSTQET